MSLLNVDQEKCNRDGICIEICPARIIEFKEKDVFPTLIDGGELFCINCGHCVAVCPHGAMSHKIMKSVDCPPVKEESPLAAAMHLDRVVSAWEDDRDRICRNAPHLIVAHAHKEDRTAPAACTIALTYLELASVPLGFGACWAGYFNAAANFWPPLQAALKLQKDHIPFGAMMVGYPKFRYHRLPLRNDPRITWG